MTHIYIFVTVKVYICTYRLNNTINMYTTDITSCIKTTNSITIQTSTKMVSHFKTVY